MDKREYLPSYLMSSQVFREVYQCNMGEVADYHRAIDDLTAQAYIEKATWGLKFWESFLGVPMNENKTLEERRSVIKSKLRGHGTATVELMKVVANAYENGQIDILENVRNRIPPLQTPGAWTLHSNTVVLEEYSLLLNATASAQESCIMIHVSPDTTYFFTGYINDAHALYRLQLYDANGDKIKEIVPDHIAGVNTHTFKTPAGTQQMEIALTSEAAGEFIFRDFMIIQESGGKKFRPYRPHTFTIQFIGDHGTPPNLSDLQAAIQRIKPAHLDVIYKFSYLLIEDLQGMPIPDLQTKKIELFAGGGDK